MRTPLILNVCFLSSLLLLTACDKERSETPVPLMDPVKAGTWPSTVTETSVPAANSVLTPENETPKVGAASNRSDVKMTPAQESSAMPMVGQNNDHSAPSAAAKPASAP